MKQRTNNYVYKAVLVVFLLVISQIDVFAQAKKSKIYEQYIEAHRVVAIDNMKTYKIPASITLGQGLLESNGGTSDLTLRSNNHFGIKCHNDWDGESVTAKDDGPNDCFRKYKNDAASYEDHSKFLTGKPRYQFLFSLDITDYKDWATGLQKAGYATDKAYANKLIKIIEDYELYRYDKKGDWDKIEKEVEKIVNSKSYQHTPYRTFGLVYVIAQTDDTYRAVAAEFDFNVKDLYKFNEVSEGFPLQLGDLIYLQDKKTKADKPYFEHVVKVGDSMHSIAQLYGIKVKSLYKMNKQNLDYIPEEGDVLVLR